MRTSVRTHFDSSNPVPRLFLGFLFVLGNAALQAQSESQQEQAVERGITVRLANGQKIVGELDRATNDQDLSVGIVVGSSQAVRRIAWAKIQSVAFRGQDYPLDEFRTLARQVANQSARQKPPEVPLLRFEARHWNHGPEANPLSRPGWLSLPPTTHLRVSAAVDHWDADALTDGLSVVALPLSHDRFPTPVSGTLEIVLRGQRLSTRGDALLVLGRWSTIVRPEDFSPCGACVRLPFQGVHPERDPQITWRGLLEARLIVPGQGVFSAPPIAVRLRPTPVIQNLAAAANLP
jgi:hypothetical protein